MAVISESELRAAREALALTAPGAGPIELFDGALAGLGAQARELALREAARSLRALGEQVAELSQVAEALQRLERAGAQRAVVIDAPERCAETGTRLCVAPLGQPGQFVAGLLPGVDAEGIELGDEVELVRAGLDLLAVRRRVGRHRRHGVVARVEEVLSPDLLRVRCGPESLFLRSVAAFRRELADLEETPGAALGRLVAFDPALGLAFGFLGRPGREELLLRDPPRVKREELILEPALLRFFDEEVLLPERNLELARSHGVEPVRVLILAGPPGTGKTHTARWLASELERPLFLISGAELADPWYGGSEAKLQARLEAAAREPEGAILVWDEAESQLGERGTSLVGVEDRLVSLLLAFTDGFVRRGRVLLVVTTNRADRLDAALRRDLRGVTVEFRRPDALCTRRLFELRLRDLPCAEGDPESLARDATIATFAEREPIADAVLRDSRRVAVRRSAVVSGALVRAACERAQRLAFVRQLHARSEDGRRGILRDDLLRALDERFAAAGETLTTRNLLHAASLPGIEAGEVVAVERRRDDRQRLHFCVPEA